MEQKKISVLICLDLSAAFDTVDHNILLKTLENSYGITDSALEWFDSYLRGRPITVNVGKSYSNQRPIPYSVLQGSINGPVLFNCYYSSLKNHVPGHFGLSGFAHDHTILSKFDPNNNGDEQHCILELEHCLVDVNEWMNKSRLKMNPSKTEFIKFGGQHQLLKSAVTST